MSELSFRTLDVFTRQRFGGNPLAVVLGADALSAAQMQRIAREFGLSETVFLLSTGDDAAVDAAMRLRIFTPFEELPFAGHPVIGAACTLARLGLVPPGSELRLGLQTGAGVVSVWIRATDDEVRAELTTIGVPRFGAVIEHGATLTALASSLGLALEDIGGNTSWPRVVDCGLPFLLVPLRRPETLAGIEVDMPRLTATLRDAGAFGAYLHAQGYEGEMRCRMFAPGIGEDPATGAAAAALAARMALETTPPGSRWQGSVVQGLEMGRPGRIELGADHTADGIGAVTVGGHAVEIMRGSLNVD